ncbi:MAG: DUF3375 domain-containing protein, partial [Fibrobacterota bacterium]|nr:DUF3375 domain-containing protein [Chitinispirillaceae bacterium]
RVCIESIFRKNMSTSYTSLNQLFKIHPSWRLLRAENAPLILSFLDKVFVQPNVRIMTQADLVSKLDDTLYQLRISEGAECFPRTAQAYLDDWAQNEKGWLRKYYPVGSDEPHYDLTPSTEKVLTWVDSLTGKSFIGTESRLLTIFELLKQMVHGTETDAETRITELEKRKAELDAEIEAIKSGHMVLMDETSIRDRFMQFSTMARELLSDFRAVEHNFRLLDSQVREKIATWDGTKGALLEKIFGDRDVIVDSDQGRSFKAFFDFLMSSSSQEEFTSLLDKVFSMEALAAFTEDRRLRRIHFDWLEAGEHTQRTVASLSQQLRRYLDNQAYLENKRIMEILDSIAQGALQVKEQIPKGNFMTVDEPAPDINLPMERPLYTPPLKVTIDSIVQQAVEEGIDLQALYDQVYVDKKVLLAHIQKELQSHSQVTLSAVIEKHPLSKGLAELVTYLAIASENRFTIFNDIHSEEIRWQDSNGIEKKAHLPQVIFNRNNHG